MYVGMGRNVRQAIRQIWKKRKVGKKCRTRPIGQSRWRSADSIKGSPVKGRLSKVVCQRLSVEVEGLLSVRLRFGWNHDPSVAWPDIDSRNDNEGRGW